MTPNELAALLRTWHTIAPHEINSYVCRCNEQYALNRGRKADFEDTEWDLQLEREQTKDDEKYGVNYDERV